MSTPGNNSSNAAKAPSLRAAGGVDYKIATKTRMQPQTRRHEMFARKARGRAR
jgi:hypothetical protein